MTGPSLTRRKEKASGTANDEELADSGVVVQVALPIPGVKDVEVEGEGAGDQAE